MAHNYYRSNQVVLMPLAFMLVLKTNFIFTTQILKGYSLLYINTLISCPKEIHEQQKIPS